MGWLRLVGSLKLLVSFAEFRLFHRALLQKRPIILRSLLRVATPCLQVHGSFSSTEPYDYWPLVLKETCNVWHPMHLRHPVMTQTCGAHQPSDQEYCSNNNVNPEDTKFV